MASEKLKPRHGGGSGYIGRHILLWGFPFSSKTIYSRTGEVAIWLLQTFRTRFELGPDVHHEVGLRSRLLY